MDKSQNRKKNYWGVTAPAATGRANQFEGTFKECWDWMVENYGNMTVKNLCVKQGVKIERIG